MPVDGKDFLINAKVSMFEARASAANSSLAAGRGTGDNSSDLHKRQIEEAARDFEALLIGEMLKSMWASVENGGLLGGGREEELYREMLNDAVAQSMAEGQGIGIKEIITREIERLETK